MYREAKVFSLSITNPNGRQTKKFDSNVDALKISFTSATREAKGQQMTRYVQNRLFW